MNSGATILPGARVRTTDGLIGTFERWDDSGGASGHQPTTLVVRSDDGRWRYLLPAMLVGSVTQGTFYTVVQVTIGADELVHYITEEITPPAGDVRVAPLPDGVWLPQEPEATLRIPLAAEEITTAKRLIELGTIHIHKGVRTAEQNVTVPLYHEEAIVEHIAPEQYDASVPPGPNEVIVPIVEEQLVVEKRTVVTAYVRVRKNVVTVPQEVRDTVRQEYVEVTERRRTGAGASEAPLIREGAARDDGATVGREA